ncbi:MAG TPA: adenylate/guanylate cyclase domain-containing protein [Solirubrobacteraceae bacterium]|nr:adenylate/guanylate cyclase domain-containing protein [Solirubrobacteraceae bacterium]
MPDSLRSVPETRYARNGDVHIAYQVFGEGEATFVGLPGIISNIELIWEEAEARRWLERLGSFARVIHYDKRGQGMSDREAGVPTFDDRLGDLVAVLDAVGVEQVALGGVSEGGTTAVLFAATYPERVSALALHGTFARMEQARGDAFVPHWAEHWGTPRTLTVAAIAPKKIGDAEYLRWTNRFERMTTTPAGLTAAWHWIRDIDVRPVLDSIHCPTLIIHRTDDRLIPVSCGRELAERIRGARLFESQGDFHLPQHGDTESELKLLEEFLTGRHTSPERHDRVLATVLFTDIVDSTRRAAALGDGAWRELLDRHDTISYGTIADCGGRLVKTTGDGVLATFDAPIRGLRCADTLRASLADAGIAIRAGVHTGEIELRNDDVAGIGVHIAARVAAQADAGELLASRTVKDLVAGSDYAFVSRGMHSLKGVPEEWELLAVS